MLPINQNKLYINWIICKNYILNIIFLWRIHGIAMEKHCKLIKCNVVELLYIIKVYLLISNSVWLIKKWCFLMECIFVIDKVCSLFIVILIIKM